MRLSTAQEFTELERWLVVSIATYKSSPSRGLAKTISFYLTCLLQHDDIDRCGNKRCDYLSMQRFWHWYAIK